MEISVDVLNSLWSTYGDYVTNMEELREVVSEVLTQPPKFTTVRVNTLRHDIVKTRSRVQQHLRHANPHRSYQVLQHLTLPDLLVIPSLPTPSTGLSVATDCDVMVDAVCGAAVMRGAPIYGVGVLSAPNHMQPGHLVSLYADLEGKCLRGSTQTYSGRRFYLGQGVAVMSREFIFTTSTKELRGVAVDVTQPLISSPTLNNLLTAEIFPQNLPSVVCGHVLGPQPGEVVLDMCASPGGKTSHIASLMGDRGVVVAVDRSEKKVVRLREVCAGLGLTSVYCYAYDGARIMSEGVDGKRVYPGDRPLPPPYLPETFNRVLVDAPCSALGKRPQLSNRMIASQVRSYPYLQQKLLAAAVKVLKVGGVMVYSTCTLTLAENEAQVHWLLSTYPNQLRLVSQRPWVVSRVGGLEGAKLSREERDKLQRFDPLLRALKSRKGDDGDGDAPLYNLDTIGFFIAKFIKVRSSLEN